MTVAVTGASGFIGSHLMRALVALGEEVVAVSRHPLVGPPAGVRHVALDIATAGIDAYDRIGRPDLLVHLAWGGLPNYLSFHHFETELPVHFRFLRALVEAGLPAMTVAGTCYEYGMIDGELEESRPVNPTNPYGYAKLALHRQLSFLQAERSFALTWVRLFYMWGEGQAATSIYPLLQAAIARGDLAFPMSAGEQLRDYLPVETVAATIASLAILRRDIGIVNVSSGRPVSVRGLVERWIAEAGAAIVPELDRYPYPTYEPLAFWGSNAKRHAILDG